MIIIFIKGAIVLNQKFTPFKNDVQTSEKIITIEDGKLSQGSEIWEEFKLNSSNGNSDEIKIVHSKEGNFSNSTLKYDGELFFYYDEKGNVSTKMKYLLDVIGEMAITEKENRKSRMVVLANQEYTFDQLFGSTISSNSADFIDFEIIFWE